MWTAEEKERQRVLDALALRTGKASDWLAADTHFIQTDRKYDRQRDAQPYADVLLDIITTAAEAFRLAGEKEFHFRRKRVDETANKRWSRATDARTFFKSDNFRQIIEILGFESEEFAPRIQSLLTQQYQCRRVLMPKN